MVEKRRLLIPGGAGYLGARLAQALAGDYEVFVTCRNLSPARERWLKQTPGIHAVQFDAASQKEFSFEVPFDAAINLAMPGADEAQRDPAESHRQAVQITQNLVSLAARGMLPRLIHFSTFRVYGTDAGREFYTETDEPRPQHPYAQNHLACERMLRETAWGALFILRPTNIVAAPAHCDLGPQSNLLFLSLCRQVAQMGTIRLENDGLSYRDFICFDDMLAAVRLLLSSPAPVCPVLNLSAASASRLDTFAELIRRAAAGITGAAPEIVFGTRTDAWRHPFVVSNKRMWNLGWNPQLDFTSEIGRTLSFFAHLS
ncbi:MAG: NAD(P)-dependent oxidoreductase [Acidobacteriia bacterium]|nr:NAD(P)-dependent oxidoreductase [Terriglobia bacterium]MBV8902447.1 NAD(P)-dependent oxidoreductase [Terriglobia bacterium]MBV9743830.1 NAD(P)-dependent oxidoreductase [Terriglobia bacterium]